MSKTGLQTGSELGHYKRYDKHPHLEDRYFERYRTRSGQVYEVWRESSTWPRCQRYLNGTLNKSGLMNNCVDQSVLQTGSDMDDIVNRFRMGDPHPEHDDFIFKCYQRTCTNQELWKRKDDPWYLDYVSKRKSHGKMINQEALRTGSDKKFRMRDPHPTVPGYYFSQYLRGRELWINQETFDKDPRFSGYIGNKVPQSEIQTGSKIGSIPRNTPHPDHQHLRFYGYKNGFEHWINPEVCSPALLERLEYVRSTTDHSEYQTGSGYGYYTQQDPHPHVDNLYFAGYNACKLNEKPTGEYTERWVPKQYFIDASQKRWENRKAIQESQRRTMAKRPGHYASQNRLSVMKYNDRKKSGYDSLSDDEKKLVSNYYDYRERLNACTGIKLGDSLIWQVDHIVPLANGGKHTPDNLQVVPKSWNCKKGAHHQGIWEPTGR
jgi:hypothetical protein